MVNLWIYISSVLICSIGSYLIAIKVQQQKAVKQIAEATSELELSLSDREDEIKQLKQELADTNYKLSEIQKDYNYTLYRLNKDDQTE